MKNHKHNSQEYIGIRNYQDGSFHYYSSDYNHSIPAGNYSLLNLELNLLHYHYYVGVGRLHHRENDINVRFGRNHHRENDINVRFGRNHHRENDINVRFGRNHVVAGKIRVYISWECDDACCNCEGNIPNHDNKTLIHQQNN